MFFNALLAGLNARSALRNSSDDAFTLPVSRNNKGPIVMVGGSPPEGRQGDVGQVVSHVPAKNIVSILIADCL